MTDGLFTFPLVEIFAGNRLHLFEPPTDGVERGRAADDKHAVEIDRAARPAETDREEGIPRYCTWR